jgi:hypothetical protein
VLSLVDLQKAGLNYLKVKQKSTKSFCKAVRCSYTYYSDCYFQDVVLN